MFPRSVLPASRTEGGGKGEEKRHNNMHEPNKQTFFFFFKQHSCGVIHKTSNLFIIRVKSHYHSENLEGKEREREGAGMLMLTGKSSF